MEAVRQSCASRSSRVVAGLVSAALLALVVAAVVALASLTAAGRRAASHDYEMAAGEAGIGRKGTAASGVGGRAEGGAAVREGGSGGEAPMAPAALTAEGAAAMKCAYYCGAGVSDCRINDDTEEIVYCMCGGVVTLSQC